MDSTSKRISNNRKAQSPVSLESVYSALTQMGERVDNLQKQVDKLSATAGLATYGSMPTLSTEDAKRQQEIIASGNGWAAYYFANQIAGADIQALQQVVLDSGDGYDTYHFARYIDGADLVALHKKINKMGGQYLKSFNNDPNIQARLKAQLDASGQSEPEEITHSKKHRPS